MRKYFALILLTTFSTLAFAKPIQPDLSDSQYLKIVTPEHMKRESAKLNKCMRDSVLKLIEFKVDRESSFINELISNSIQVKITIDRKASEDRVEFTDGLVITLSDRGKDWCEFDYETMFLEVFDKTVDVLDKRFPVQVFKIFALIEELAKDKMKSPTEVCNKKDELKELTNETFIDYKFNEITGDVFYPDGKLVTNEQLKKLLFKYFYDRRHGSVQMKLNGFDADFIQPIFDTYFELNLETNKLKLKDNLSLSKENREYLKRNYLENVERNAIMKKYFIDKLNFQYSHIVEGGMLEVKSYYKGSGAKRIACIKKFKERNREGKLVLINGKERCFPWPDRPNHNPLAKIFASLFLNVQEDNNPSRKVYETVIICDAKRNCSTFENFSIEDLNRESKNRNMKFVCSSNKQGSKLDCIMYEGNQTFQYDSKGKPVVLNQGQYLDEDDIVQTLEEGQRIQLDSNGKPIVLSEGEYLFNDGSVRELEDSERIQSDSNGNQVVLNENQYLDSDGNLQTVEEGQRLGFDSDLNPVPLNDDQALINDQVVQMPHNQSDVDEIFKGWEDRGIDDKEVLGMNEEKIRDYIDKGSITIKEMETIQEQFEAHVEHINDEKAKSDLRKFRELIEKLKEG